MAVKRLKRRYWKGIFYPESAPDWERIIEDCGLSVVVSPEHNRDVYTDSDPMEIEFGTVLNDVLYKKIHRHYIVYHDGPETCDKALALSRILGVNKVMPVDSLRRDERYLCHLDSPKKALYSVDDVICFGGAIPTYLNEELDLDDFVKLTSFIETEGIQFYCDLSSLVTFQYPELISCLTRYSVHFNNYLRSRHDLSKHFNGDKMSYVKSRIRFGYFSDSEVFNGK